MAMAAIACGVVWIVLGPSPASKPVRDEPASRRLAYEEAVADRPQPVVPAEESKPEETIPPFETVTTESPPETPAADANEDAADSAPLADEVAAAATGGEDVMATVPGQEDRTDNPLPPLPGEEAGAPDQMTALPEAGTQEPPLNPEGRWGPDGSDQGGYDGSGQWDDNGPPPGENGQWGDDGSQQWGENGAAQDGAPPEEWVEVIISGAAMRATASDDAPMLFAFPYGRNLRVVSRYEGWVEVTDPQSAATGWMKMSYLAPARAARSPYAESEPYYEDPRADRGPGWFRRRPGGIADMINKALGGGW
jgi:hypothetical protein